MRHKTLEQAVAYEQAVTLDLRLSEEELHGLLKESIARQSDAESMHSAAYSLEDALKIARELDIPVEHVYAAAESWQTRAEKERRRATFRGKVKQKNRIAALLLAGWACVGAFFYAIDPANFATHALFLVLPVAGTFVAWRVPITDEDIDRVSGKLRE